MKKHHLLDLFILLVLGFAVMALLTAACSSSSDPTSPITQGKGVVRGTVTDGGGEPVDGAVILVDGEPVTTTNENGVFSIELDPGTYLIEAQVDGQTLWSLEITIREGEDNDVTDPDGPDDDINGDDGQNGIGPCVSECVHIYGPPNPDSDADPLPGKFNAKPCVEFCKGTSYRGGASKDADGRCNEFYTQSDPDCGPWPNGSPCKVDAVCESGYCDESGVCAVKENGESCDDDRECVSGICHEDNLCGLPLDEICTDDDECRSNVCDEEDGGNPLQMICLEPQL